MSNSNKIFRDCWTNIKVRVMNILIHTAALFPGQLPKDSYQPNKNKKTKLIQNDFSTYSHCIFKPLIKQLN